MDGRKGVTISYNVLNLPDKVRLNTSANTEKAAFVYLADGTSVGMFARLSGTTYAGNLTLGTLTYTCQMDVESATYAFRLSTWQRFPAQRPVSRPGRHEDTAEARFHVHLAKRTAAASTLRWWYRARNLQREESMHRLEERGRMCGTTLVTTLAVRAS